MAQTLTNEGFDVSNILGNSSHRQIDEEVAILPGKTFPLVSKISWDPARRLNNGKFEWIKDEMLAHETTIAEALDTTETAIDVASGFGDAFQEGQVIKVDDELMRVESISGDTLTVERDYAGTTAASHSSGATILLMLPGFLDTDEFKRGVSSFGETEYNYYKYTNFFLGETYARTAEVNYLTRGQDEVEFQWQKQLVHRMRLLERDVLYGQRQQPTASVEGGFQGIIPFISTNLTTVSGVLEVSDLIDALNDLHDYDENHPVVMVMNRACKRIFNAVLRQFVEIKAEPMVSELGVTMDRLHTDIGVLDCLISDSLAETDEILMLNLGDIKLVPIQHKYGSGWIEYTQDHTILNRTEQRKGCFNMMSLKVGNEKRHARLTGFTTTPASYPGYA